MKLSSYQAFKSAYRDTIEKELGDPSVRRAKKELIDAAFKPHSTGPYVMGICLVLLAFGFAGVYLFYPKIAAKKNTALEPAYEIVSTQKDLETLTEKITGETAQDVIRRPNIEVMRVSSKTGSTIVYQRLHEDTPITVVWVLTGGSVK